MRAMSEDERVLESLIQENAALQAENEALRAETFELCGGPPAALGDDEPLRASGWSPADPLEALKREQEALLGVLEIGKELEELRRINSALQEQVEGLREDNSVLRTESLALRDSRAAASALPAPAHTPAPAVAGTTQPTAGKGSLDGNCLNDDDGHSKGDQRARELSTGNPDALVACSPEQRKEAIAALLKAGLFDVSSATGAKERAALPVAGPGDGRAPAAMTLDTGASAKPAPSPGAPRDAAAAPSPAPAPAEHRRPAAPAPAPAAPASLERTALPKPAAPAAAAPASLERTALPKPAAPAPAPAAPASLERTALPKAGVATDPQRRGRAQEIGEALRRGDTKALTKCSSDERKELVAEMLKNGLFDPLPAPNSKSAAGTTAAGVDEPRSADGESNKYAQELQVREMLQGLAVAPEEPRIITDSPACRQSILGGGETLSSKLAERLEEDEAPFSRSVAVREMLQGLSAAGGR